MNKTSKPIVFFGSGPVAAESLRLLAQDFVIEAVITKPRPAHHKGSVPVLDVAQDLHLKVLTASSKASLDTLFATHPVHSDLAILVDFGIIVSQAVIDYFPFGIINSHFSLLPEWRGADPITFAILSGQQRTGVSLMLLVAGMDEGPLLGYGEYDLSPTTTTPQLTHDLILLSNELLRVIVPLYRKGDATLRPQDTSIIPTYSRKLTKEDGLIDWHKPAVQIEREISAFLGWPKSRTTLGSVDVVITQAHVVPANGVPGTIMVRGRELLVYCGNEALSIDQLKPAGKQEMTGEAFIAGYKKRLTIP
jgi:methionyl-tRNA formyltransferase